MGEFLQGRITLRALRVLVTHLPGDSPAAIARRENDWETPEWISWDISAQLRILNTTLGNLFRKDGAPMKQPEFIPTPEQPETAEQMLAAEAEKKYHEQVRAEMDETIQRIFVNPN